MTGLSQPRTSRPLSEIELPDPQSDPGLIRTFAGYRAALVRLTPDQLLRHSTDLAARIELENRQILGSLLSGPLSGSTSSLDQPVIRSPRTGLPTSAYPDRGQAHSRPSLPPPPSAVDLLAASRRLTGSSFTTAPPPGRRRVERD